MRLTHLGFGLRIVAVFPISVRPTSVNFFIPVVNLHRDRSAAFKGDLLDVTLPRESSRACGVRTYVRCRWTNIRTYLGTYLQRTCVRNVVAGLGSHAHALFSSAPIRGIRLDTYIFAAPVEYLRTSVASGRRTDPTCTDPTLEIVRLRQCALAASCFTNVSTYW